MRDCRCRRMDRRPRRRAVAWVGCRPDRRSRAGIVDWLRYDSGRRVCDQPNGHSHRWLRAAAEVTRPINFPKIRQNQGSVTHRFAGPCHEHDRRSFTAARFSTAAAIRPSKSTSTLADGSIGRAAVPSGASTGAHEAWELRDGDKSVVSRQGRDARRSTTSTTTIADELIGMDALDQVGDRPADDRARRHAEQEEAGRQRHPRRLAGRGPCGGPITASCRCIATWAASDAQPAAGADDEHRQRRPARRQRASTCRSSWSCRWASTLQRRPALRRARSSTTSRRCCTTRS